VTAGDQLLIDPIKLLCKFGIQDAKYAGANQRTLLKNSKAKAMSTMAMVNGCPIVTQFCAKVLDLTKGLTPRKRQMIENTPYLLRGVLDVNDKFTPKTPTEESRHVVERLFGVSIAQQFLFEKTINDIKSIEDFSKIEVLDFLDSALVQNYRDNVRALKDPPRLRTRKDKLDPVFLATRASNTSSDNRIAALQSRIDDEIAATGNVNGTLLTQLEATATGARVASYYR